jgi:hypothetical protein
MAPRAHALRRPKGRRRLRRAHLELPHTGLIRITLKSSVSGPVVAAATAYRDAGVDLIIVNLPHHAKPDSLQPLAEALAPLA